MPSSHGCDTSPRSHVISGSCQRLSAQRGLFRTCKTRAVCAASPGVPGTPSRTCVCTAVASAPGFPSPGTALSSCCRTPAQSGPASWLCKEERITQTGDLDEGAPADTLGRGGGIRRSKLPRKGVEPSFQQEHVSALIRASCTLVPPLR